VCATVNLRGRDEGGARGDGTRDVPAEGVGRAGVVRELDDERELAHVGGDAFDLERLEAGPGEERLVRGGELAELLGEVLVGVARAGLLRGGESALRVLADRAVLRPVVLLAL
jgi:hypothetical protein